MVWGHCLIVQGYGAQDLHWQSLGANMGLGHYTWMLFNGNLRSLFYVLVKGMTKFGIIKVYYSQLVLEKKKKKTLLVVKENNLETFEDYK